MDEDNRGPRNEDVLGQEQNIQRGSISPDNGMKTIQGNLQVFPYFQLKGNTQGLHGQAHRTTFGGIPPE